MANRRSIWRSRQSGWEMEKAEVDTLLKALADLRRRKARTQRRKHLLELIYKLQQEEAEPELKVLGVHRVRPHPGDAVPVPGTAGLQGRPAERDRWTWRTNVGRPRISSPETVRFLVSTEAGGEGLNLQFCHVVVNFDMPWNPMRLEQRIGRVDRIGQTKAVRALNFLLQRYG